MSELIINLLTLNISASYLIAVFSLPFIIIIIVFISQRNAYMKTDYYFDTHKPYFTMRRDTGSYGEYLIYKKLVNLKGNKKFLFNCYIPKDDGTTSEIDVILLHSSGIYVFESKNYSGWIFGTESQKMWTQTLPNGTKEKFYNPLMQNNSHIKWLKHILPDVDEKIFHSIIIFSERCELKKIKLTTDNHKVIKRYNLPRAITTSSNETVLSNDMIETIYEKLYPLTQTTAEARTAHVNTINKRTNRVN